MFLLQAPAPVGVRPQQPKALDLNDIDRVTIENPGNPNPQPPAAEDHVILAALTKSPHENTGPHAPGTTETVFRGTSRVTNSIVLIQNIRRLHQLIGIARTGVSATAIATTGGRLGTRAVPIAGAILTAGEIGSDYYSASQMPSTPREVATLALQGIQLSPEQIAAGTTVDGIRDRIVELAGTNPSTHLENTENATRLRTFLMENLGLNAEHTNQLIDCMKQAPVRRAGAMADADTGMGCAVVGGGVAFGVLGVIATGAALNFWNPVGWGLGLVAGALAIGIGIGYLLHSLRDVPIIGTVGRAIGTVGKAVGSAIGGFFRSIFS